MQPLTDFSITRFVVPIRRRIGGHDCVLDTIWLAALELRDAAQRTGLGFAASLRSPLPPLAELTDHFARHAWPLLAGLVPEAGILRLHPAVGDPSGRLSFNLDNALDQSLWDLAAKRAGVPLYRYLGGNHARVAAYASGLCFHLSEGDFYEWYARAAAAGYRAVKIKVGHEDVSWEIRRLSLVREAYGDRSPRLMVDANEAWTVDETANRLRAYREAGFVIDWAEDPIPDTSVAGLRSLRGALGGARVNSGENLTADGRLGLLCAAAVDILNINDIITDGLRVAWAASARGIPVTLGNTVMNIGAHLAAALPNVDLVEDSQLPWTELVARPIPVVAGEFQLGGDPGHGLTLSPQAHLFADPGGE